MPVIHATSHVYHEKRVAWVSISMHACDSVPIVMGLRLAALWGRRSSTTNLTYRIALSYPVSSGVHQGRAVRGVSALYKDRCNGDKNIPFPAASSYTL